MDWNCDETSAMAMNGKTATAAGGGVTLVTVTYGDRLRFLAEAVRCALEVEGVDRALVVSNASRSPLDELERTWGGRVRIIRLAANTGSANGYAVGIQAALDDGADYLWLMDDDNAPRPGALQALLAARDQLAARPLNDFALLSFRPTVQGDIAAGIPPHRCLPRPGCFLGFHLYDLPYKLWRRTLWFKPAAAELPELIPVPHAPYGGFFAHRSVFGRIGLPDNNLVLYADDTQLTARLTEDGGQILLVTGSILDDLDESWSSPTRFSSAVAGRLCGPSDFRAYYSTRNQVYVETSNDRHPAMRAVNRFLYLGILLAVALSRGRLDRFRLLRTAIRHGEAGRLGLNENFPLPCPPGPVAN